MRYITAQEIDKKKLAILFREAFGHERPEKTWQWLYRGHKLDQYRLAAVDARNNLVAYYASIPIQVKYFDKSFQFGQVVDTMVRLDHRGGFGRKFLLMELASEFNRMSTGVNLNIVLFGLPDYSIGKVGKIKLGYKTLQRIIYLKRNLRNENIPKPHDNIFSRRIYSLERVNPGILKSYMDNYAVQVIKSREYLIWRYDDNPEKDYCYYEIYRENIILGYIVVSDEYLPEKNHFPDHRIAIVTEWIIPHDHLEHFPDILQLIETEMKVYGIELLFFLFAPHSVEYQRLKKYGYVERHGAYRLAIRLFSPDVNEKILQENWQYTIGDFDVV